MTKHLEWWITHDQVDFFSHFEEAIKSGSDYRARSRDLLGGVQPHPNNQNPGGIWGAFEAGATANISGRYRFPHNPECRKYPGSRPQYFCRNAPIEVWGSPDFASSSR